MMAEKPANIQENLLVIMRQRLKFCNNQELMLYGAKRNSLVA